MEENLLFSRCSIVSSSNLRDSSLEFCFNLRSRPSSFKLKSLDTLLFTPCKKLEVFLEFVEKMPCLEKLYLMCSSIENIMRLEVLTATYCNNLANSPAAFIIQVILSVIFLKLKNWQVYSEWTKRGAFKLPQDPATILFVIEEDLQLQAMFWIYSFSSLWCPILISGSAKLQSN
ncbi:LOW QUALITY PROTEIN: hypothetical protein NC651_039505 [Populus alba x Populus x berolinensis]|nr:LOW QUALITY PROTEIN: hypothetical protein NC651_039505 [Populus alba x Populus x berolinensis]